ncbi:unnamed protein product, partial [marine sediment metagenome]
EFVRIWIYVDGEEKAYGAVETDQLSGAGNPLYLGTTQGGGSEWFDGTLDEVRISDVARTPWEMIKAARPTAGYQLSTNGGTNWGANSPDFNDDKWIDYRWGEERWTVRCSGDDGSTSEETLFAYNVPAFPSIHASNNQIRFRIADLGGNTTTSAYTIKMENSSPAGWTKFSPSDWTSNLTPDCSVDVTDSGGSGISAASAMYAYTKDGGLSWLPGDDFTDGDYTTDPITWTTTNGTWDASSGILKQTNASGGWYWCQDLGNTYDDFILEFDFKVVDPG